MSQLEDQRLLHPICCSCCDDVERLRAQNKASADDWTRKYGVLEHELASIRRAQRYASELVGERVDPESHLVFNGLSAVGRQAIADLKRRMERAESEWFLINSAKYRAEDRLIELQHAVQPLHAEYEALRGLGPLRDEWEHLAQLMGWPDDLDKSEAIV